MHSSGSAEGMAGPLVVITGAGRGVGFETARALLSGHHAEVIAVSRDISAWTDVHRTHRLLTVSADLSTAAGLDAVLRAVGDRPLFGLVNNAGMLIKRALGEWTSEDLDALHAVNVRAPLLITQALVPALRKSDAAHVVNIGSMGGFQGSVKFAGLTAYSASKAALACLTECLAEELKDSAIRCNCLCLGAVDTPMLRCAFPGYQAPTTAPTMGRFIAEFLLQGHNVLNGKVLPVSLSTP